MYTITHWSSISYYYIPYVSMPHVYISNIYNFAVPVLLVRYRALLGSVLPPIEVPTGTVYLFIGMRVRSPRSHKTPAGPQHPAVLHTHLGG